MVSHMKTTIDIADPLLQEAKRVAAAEKTTLRALVEQGLRSALEQRRTRGTYRMRDASVGGGGLHPDVAHLSMQEIIDLSYGDRGA
jgi:Arc/MetJ family transcription regulator